MSVLRWLGQALCGHRYVSETGEPLAVRGWIGSGQGRSLSVGLHGLEYIHSAHQLRDGVCRKCGHARLDATALREGGVRAKTMMRRMRGEIIVEPGQLSITPCHMSEVDP